MSSVARLIRQSGESFVPFAKDKNNSNRLLTRRERWFWTNLHPEKNILRGLIYLWGFQRRGSSTLQRQEYRIRVGSFAHHLSKLLPVTKLGLIRDVSMNLFSVLMDLGPHATGHPSPPQFSGDGGIYSMVTYRLPPSFYVDNPQIVSLYRKFFIEMERKFPALLSTILSLHINNTDTSRVFAFIITSFRCMFYIGIGPYCKPKKHLESHAKKITTRAEEAERLMYMLNVRYYHADNSMNDNPHKLEVTASDDIVCDELKYFPQPTYLGYG